MKDSFLRLENGELVIISYDELTDGELWEEVARAIEKGRPLVVPDDAPLPPVVPIRDDGDEPNP